MAPDQLFFGEAERRGRRERRDAVRVEIPSAKVLVCETVVVSGNPRPNGEAPAADISRGGVRLRVSRLRRPAKVGERVRIGAQYPLGHFELHGSVQRVDKGLLHADIGVCFEEDELFDRNRDRLEECLRYFGDDSVTKTKGSLELAIRRHDDDDET